MQITLNIQPPKGTAQMQKTAVRHGRIIKYDPPEVNVMKSLFTLLLTPKRPTEPLEGALKLEIVFVYPFRKADKFTFDTWKDTQPDCDNLVKGLQDVMEKIGYFTNDGQIAHLVVKKFWGANPKIVIELDEL